MKQTIEQKAADTILGTNLGAIEIDGTTYNIEPPTTATLVMVSGLISQLPEITEKEENESVSSWVFKHAHEAAPILAKISAILIIGAKEIRREPTIEIETGSRKWNWHKLRFVTAKTKMDAVEHLTNRILEELTPTDLKDFILNITTAEEITDFFLLTTSLRTKNILAKTTETEVEMTVSGDLS